MVNETQKKAGRPRKDNWQKTLRLSRESWMHLRTWKRGLEDQGLNISESQIVQDLILNNLGSK